MNSHEQPKPDTGASLTQTAIESGLSALSVASSGAKTGAKIAVGTLFAGCNVLLDLGVRVTRKLPLGDENTGLHLKTKDGEIPVVAREIGRIGGEMLGWWTPDDATTHDATTHTTPDGAIHRSTAQNDAVPQVGDEAISRALSAITRNIYAVDCEGMIGIGLGGRAVLGADTASVARSYPLRAFAPALHPRQLGDPAFREAHGLKYAYVAGAMANGISSEELVETMNAAGMMGFFGAAGLSLERIESAIDRLQRSLGDGPFGMNLIHSPNEPDLEAAVVDLYLHRGVRTVSAAAYLDITLPLIHYRLSGIRREPSGRIICPNKVLAKLSRVEVAAKFMSPPPAEMVNALVDSGDLTHEQAALAESVPVAEDITVEADSAGHTDNRPAISLLPIMIALRDEQQAKFAYATPIRIGAAGGISTPASAAAAFAMGAAYILTGSVNQACIESGTSPAVREMLAHATQADTAMAPAADMFEMGVKVQVLKWGTMFAVRAKKLHDLYRSCSSIEDIPANQRAILERDFFRCPLEEAWAQTREFWQTRDPRQIARAEKEPRHKMALVFRSYLGRASEWANTGEPSRKVDYQVWCGPAMGAFNEWARGTFLERPERRKVVTIAKNLLLGATVLTRANWLSTQGVALSATARRFRPLEETEITSLLEE